MTFHQDAQEDFLQASCIQSPSSKTRSENLAFSLMQDQLAHAYVSFNGRKGVLNWKSCQSKWLKQAYMQVSLGSLEYNGC
mmetsp:Transcript_53631/g.100644  ORF Transcript_53631/g.100644 Transcript_53631/m.100644 type:complete len:80 (+) Transcript_53631:93-332(+)